MNSFTYILKKSKLLFLLLGSGILLLILSTLFIPSKKEVSPSPAPSAKILKGLPDFPSAQPQEFAGQKSRDQGSLVVNANTEAVKVTIDAEEVVSAEFFAPENSTPFTIAKIPAGKHVLRASKLGFLNQTFDIEIKPSEVAQINITMNPDPDFDNLQNATKGMPVSTEEYYIEYLDSIGKIQTIIRKAPFEDYKQEAINWFKQRGVNNPEASGVLFYPAVNIDQ